MAELLKEDDLSKRRPGFGRAKKQGIRVDMTPMVDLGFLLITFFIFTTSLSEPTAMGLIVPKDEGKTMPTKESGALTLIPSGNNLVYYYEGLFEPEKVRSVSFREIRNIIVHKKSATREDDLFVIIRPSKTANYKSVVDVLDEMVIAGIKRYALVKISPPEETFVK